ncbi:MAG: hypothetical protein QM501_04815 [Gimesia sp.]
MAKRPKRLMYAGGGVLILGMVLGQFFGLTPGINSGSGDGEEKPAPADDSRAIMASTVSDIVPILIQPEPKHKSLDELPLKVLDILIDNRSYLIKASSQPQERYRSAGIKEVIQQATRATGDEDGIRIRVYRKGSARVIPESLLKEELKNAGLAPQMVDWKNHLVD